MKAHVSRRGGRRHKLRQRPDKTVISPPGHAETTVATLTPSSDNYTCGEKWRTIYLTMMSTELAGVWSQAGRVIWSHVSTSTTPVLMGKKLTQYQVSVYSFVAASTWWLI